MDELKNIIESKEFEDFIEWNKSTKELKENGWTWQDINEVAKFVIKNFK